MVFPINLILNLMKNLFLLLLLTALLAGSSYSQDFSRMKGSEICSMKKSKMLHPENYFQDSPNSVNTPRHSYDVLNYKLNLDIYSCYFSPYPKSFTASNIITFRVDSTLNNIKLDVNNASLAIDSVKLISGTVLTFTHASNILTVNLDRIYNVGEVVNIRIKYRHLNVTDASFYVSGSSGYVFTDAEPEGARGWFPCWDRPSDKATIDLTAKVPLSLSVRLGGNGRLNDSTITGDSLFYHWISRDPVSTYLVVMTSKTGYQIDMIYWHKLSNPSDSIPFRFYSPTGVSSAVVKNVMNNMTNWYSQAYSEMAFEKNGFAYVPNSAGFVWGGMENQTLTTVNSWGENLASHEFAHQWWGDMVTCASWSNEGFATWSESYWVERTGGYTAYKSMINTDANSYLSGNPGWAISVPSWDITTPNTNTLFNYEITYCKGSCVLHLLRYTLGDSLFFAGLKAYGTDTTNFRLKNSTIPDFFTKMSSVAGQDLSWFYNAWIYQPNHPLYQNQYYFTNLGGGQFKVNFLAKQTQSGFFPIPIMVRISFNSGSDTTIKVMNSANNQWFSWTFNRQPTSVLFDPNNEIVIKTASLIMGTEENTSEIPAKFDLYQNYPNPFNPVTNIAFDLPKNAEVKILVYDVSGKQVEELVNEFLQAGRHSVSFNGMKKASGVYYYKIQAGDFTSVKKMIMIK